MRYRSEGDVGSQTKYFQFWEPGQKLVRILIMVFLRAAEISAAAYISRYETSTSSSIFLANAFNRSENVINGSGSIMLEVRRCRFNGKFSRINF